MAFLENIHPEPQLMDVLRGTMGMIFYEIF